MSEVCRAIYVNGIENTWDEANRTANEIQKEIGLPTSCVYNPHTLYTGVGLPEHNPQQACVVKLCDEISKHVNSRIHVLLILHSKATHIALWMLTHLHNKPSLPLQKYLTVHAYGGIAVIPNKTSDGHPLAKSVLNRLNLADNLAQYGSSVTVWNKDLSELLNSINPKVKFNRWTPLIDAESGGTTQEAKGFRIKTFGKASFSWLVLSKESRDAHGFKTGYWKVCLEDAAEFKKMVAKEQLQQRTMLILKAAVISRIYREKLFVEKNEIETVLGELDGMQDLPSINNFIIGKIQASVLLPNERQELAQQITNAQCDSGKIEVALDRYVELSLRPLKNSIQAEVAAVIEARTAKSETRWRDIKAAAIGAIIGTVIGLRTVGSLGV